MRTPTPSFVEPVLWIWQSLALQCLALHLWEEVAGGLVSSLSLEGME